MKLFQFILCVSVAFIAGGGAGFAGGWLWKSSIMQREQDARQVRAQEIIKELSDSIAATQAWIEAEQAEQVNMAEQAKQSLRDKFGHLSGSVEYRDGMRRYDEIIQQARTGQLENIAHARRHIEWMKQEQGWLSRY